MRRRPTRRSFTLIAVALLLLLLGSTAQAGWLFVLAAGTLGLVLASFLTRHRLAALEVRRVVPARIRAGDHVRVGFSVHNVGGRRTPIAALEDGFPAFAPARVALEALPAGSEGRLELVRRAERRGAFTEGVVTLSSGAPFGFVSTRRTIVVASPVVVVPRWVDLTSFPILEPSSYPAEQLHERARTGGGVEYLGVREYRPGDPPRHVHWRSSARAGRLVVREYEEEAASRVALLVTGQDTGTPPESAFEALVSAAASIALYALVTGHPVDLIGPGVPGLTDPTRHDVLDWLARLGPSDEPVEALAAQAVKRVHRRGTVVVLAPTSGRAAEGIMAGVRTAQTSGSRTVAVLARSTTWREGSRVPGVVRAEDELIHEVRSRTTTRVISKGQDLLRCLQA
ncbi:MAG: DUF58 domain-containing protein [Actinomycetota bacterium]